MKPTDKLIPFMTTNDHNVWHPTLPYAISLGGSFVESIAFLQEDSLVISLMINGKSETHPAKVMEIISVWKIELVA